MQQFAHQSYVIKDVERRNKGTSMFEKQANELCLSAKFFQQAVLTLKTLMLVSSLIYGCELKIQQRYTHSCVCACVLIPTKATLKVLNMELYEGIRSTCSYQHLRDNMQRMPQDGQGCIGCAEWRITRVLTAGNFSP